MMNTTTESIPVPDTYLECHEDLRNLLREYQEMVKRLKAVLDTDSQVIWSEIEGTKAQRVEAICEVLAQLEHEEDGDCNVTPRCAAIIGIPRDALTLIDDFNHQKAVIGAYLKKMDKKTFEQDKKVKRKKTETWTERALNRMEKHRFFRRVVLRKLHYLEDQPESISYYWSASDRVYKVTVRKVLDDLLEKDKDTYSNTKNQLAGLPDDMALARVVKANASARANVKIRKGDKLVSTQIRGVLPIFYVINPESTSPPRFKPLGPQDEARPERMKRNDVMIKDTPLIESLKLHEYIV